jgi:hypothetical protein
MKRLGVVVLVWVVLVALTGVFWVLQYSMPYKGANVAVLDEYTVVALISGGLSLLVGAFLGVCVIVKGFRWVLPRS